MTLDALTNRDRFAYGVYVPANAKVVFIEGVSTYQLTVPEGRYYLWHEVGAPSWLTTNFPSLYHAIEALVTTAAGETFTFAAGTPTTSVKQLNRGLDLIRAAGASNAFGWQFSNVNFTLDRRLLGFAPDAASIETTTNRLQSSMTRYGDWVAPRRHQSKWRHKVNVQFTGGGAFAARQTRRWRTDVVRTWRYTWVPEAHVVPKADDASYAAVAELGLGDNNNLFEDFWEVGFSSGHPVLVVHDEGHQDLAITTHPYEVITYVESEDATDFTACAPLPESGGRWEIGFAAWVSPDPDHKGYDF